MINYLIQIIQQNANFCSIDCGAKGLKFLWDLLSYTEKRMDIDGIPYNLELSFLDVTDKRISVPVGIVPFIQKKAFGTEYSIEYSPIEYLKLNKKFFPKLEGIKFESYQTKILLLINAYNRGIIVAPTAAGKTILLAGIIDKFKIPNTLVIVPTGSIARQMVLRFKEYFPNIPIGKWGDNENTIGQITVTLYQSLNKLDLRKFKIDLLLCDEVHTLNNSIIKFLKRIPNVHYRYGVTATPQKIENNLVRYMEMTGYIGPIIKEIDDQEVTERVLPVKVFMTSFLNTRPTGKSYHEVLRNDVLKSRTRTRNLLKAAKEYALCYNKTCLVLLDEIKQAEIFEEIGKEMGLNPILVHSKMKKETIENIKEKLNNRLLNLVIATKVFGVGTDIPNVDCVTMASANKSEIDTVQKIGRGRRKTSEKDYLILIDCVDRVVGKKNQHFYLHSLERIKIYKEKKWEIIKVHP